MSGSSGPIVMLQTPPLSLVSALGPPVHSPATLTSLASAARKRKVTDLSEWISGETRADASRRAGGLVRTESWAVRLSVANDKARAKSDSFITGMGNKTLGLEPGQARALVSGDAWLEEKQKEERITARRARLPVGADGFCSVAGN